MLAAVLGAAALVLPLSTTGPGWFDRPLLLLGPVVAVVVALWFRRDSNPLRAGMVGLAALAIAVWVSLQWVHQPGVAG